MPDVHIYVMGREAGPVKVGYSHDPSKRARALQGGCPFRIVVIFKSELIERKLAYQHEQLFHRLFEQRRKNGEWFNVPAINAIEEIEMIISTHEFHEKRKVRS